MSAAELHRAELRVAAVASGLLMLLDEHGITGQLPQDARNAAGQLRHTVKLAVQAAQPPTLATPPSLDGGDALAGGPGTAAGWPRPPAPRAR